MFKSCVINRQNIVVGYQNKIQGNFSDSSLLTGFTNWKYATRSFSKHEGTVCHKAAVDLVINIPSTSCELDKMLSSANEKQKVLNRKYLLNIAQTIRYLCRQGLALRGI